MTIGFPQVHLIIDGDSIGVPPQNLVQFTYTDKAGNSGDDFTIEFFDPTWELLSNKIFPALVKTDKKIEMRWGWSASNLSERRYGQVMTITPGAVSTAGVRFTLQGMDIGSVVATDKEPATYQGKISDVVAQVASRWDWLVDIAETDDIFEEDSREGGQVLRTWRKGQTTDLEFINYLAQRAKSSKEVGAYLAYFDNRTSPPTLHFHPTRAPRERLYKTYVFQSGNMGDVISFEPEVQAAAFTSMGIQNIGVYTNDPLTRESFKVETDPLKYKDSLALGQHIHIPPSDREVGVHTSSSTETEAKFRLAAFYDKMSTAAQKASLTIVGDPHVPPNSFVKVLVYTPQGLPYFTSGIWQVYTATHDVSPGSFTTTLALGRNTSMGQGGENHTMPTVTHLVSGDKEGFLSSLRSWTGL